MAIDLVERRKRHSAAVRRYQARNPDKVGNRVNRRLMISAYGGSCACCGETSPEFLQLDHIYGDGHKERNGKSNQDVVRKLKKLGWPKDRYRLLCANCNIATMFGRQCPHWADAT